MKKSILVAVAVMVAGIFTVNAQTTGNVTVNINLKKFQTLTVNQAEVNINFEDEADYTNGASSAVMNDHLTVSSTGAFQVKATAVVPEQNTTTNKALGAATSSPLSIVTSAGTEALESASYANDIELLNNTSVVSSTKGQFQKDINVQYKANRADFIGLGLINNGYLTNDMNANQYKVQVTYTISVN